MSTRLKSRRSAESSAARYARLVAALPLAWIAGCGYSQGELLFVLGMGRGAKVEAKFQLTEEPILILIDDASQRVDWPAAPRYLLDHLSQELLRNNAARRIVPPETAAQLRQTVPEFEKRGAREVGKLAGADQVLWIEVQSFHADELIQEAMEAAHFVVTIKVLNVGEKRRSRVRVWPVSPAGHRVAVSLAGSEVAIAKTKDGISRKLAESLAFKIGRLFYDHRLGEFERSP